MGSIIIYDIVLLVLGYLLAALSYRRMRWPVLERRTGWRLDGWRRWPVPIISGLLAGLATFDIDPQYARWATWLVFGAAVALLLRIGCAGNANAGNG